MLPKMNRYDSFILRLFVFINDIILDMHFHNLKSSLTDFKLKKKAPPTESEKEEAEKLKLEGNDLMRTEQFEGAIEKYTK